MSTRTPDQKILHGFGPSVWPGDTADLDYWGKLPADLKPAMGRYKFELDSPVPRPPDFWSHEVGKWLTIEKAAGRRHALVSCLPGIGLGGGQIKSLDQAVADGQYDQHFQRMANEFRKFGGDVDFTYHPECNADGRWQTGTSTPFVRVHAYRVVAWIMAQYGGGNVRMVSHYSPSGSDPRASGWSNFWWRPKWDAGAKWEGAEALSIYSTADMTPGTPQYALAHGVCVEAEKRDKPVILAELSCAFPGVMDKNAILFFDRLQQFVESHPVIATISYGQTPQGITGAKDGRLWANPEVWKRWLTFLRQPYFEHAAVGPGAT